jgi:hypothetical protein
MADQAFPGTPTTLQPAQTKATSSTVLITGASSAQQACDCTSLRYAVIALSTILGTAFMALMFGVAFKSRRWTAKGAASKNEEISTLKKAKEEAEKREREVRDRIVGRGDWRA